MAVRQRWTTEILLVLVMAGPFLQEPFFTANVFLVIALIGLVSLVWLAGRLSGGRPLGVPISLPAVGLGLLTVAYAAQLIWAVYPRGALDWVLRAAAALIVLVVVQGSASPELRRQVAWVVLLSGGVVGIHGLLQFFGAVSNPLQHTMNTAGRIPGLYNYANSTAIALGVALLAALGLALQEKERWNRWVLLGTSSLITVTLFLTLSRGVLYGLSIAILLALVGLNRQALPRALRFLAISLVVPLMIGWGLTSWGGPAPEVVSRLVDVGSESQNLVARLQFLQDALAATADRPWGYGGEGWARIYRQYQPVNYASSNPHNHYALTLVEAGVPGLLALLLALLSALWLGFRHRSKKEPLRWVLVVAGATLAGHALIDMDLSRFGLWLLLWVVLGSTLPADSGPIIIRRLRWIPATLAVVLLLGSSWLAASAITLRGLSSETTSLRGVERAIAADPWNSQPLLLLRTEPSLSQAAKVDPLNPLVWQTIAKQAEKEGDLERARQAAERALELQPALPDHYALLAHILTKQIEAALITNRNEEARRLAADLVGLGEQVTAQVARVQSTPGRWSKPQVSWTGQLHLQVGMGLYLTGGSAAAEEHLKAANQEKGYVGSMAGTWLQALYTRQGRTGDLKTLVPAPSAETLRSDLYQAIAAWKE